MKIFPINILKEQVCTDANVIISLYKIKDPLYHKYKLIITTGHEGVSFDLFRDDFVLKDNAIKFGVNGSIALSKNDFTTISGWFVKYDFK